MYNVKQCFRLYSAHQQDVLTARLSRLEAQFQSEISQLKDENAELKVQLEKANERINRLEGKVVVEDDNLEKSWLMPTNCINLYQSGSRQTNFYMIKNAQNNIDVVFCDYSRMYI